MTVIVVADTLRDRIVKEVRDMQSHRRASLAADLLPPHFDQCIDGVAALIDLDRTDDFEIAVIIAMVKWKHRNPSAFIRRRPNPSASWNSK